jgi:hypothetical protein
MARLNRALVAPAFCFGVFLLLAQGASARDEYGVRLLEWWDEEIHTHQPELSQELRALKRTALLQSGGLTSLCAGFLAFDAFALVPAVPQFVGNMNPSAQAVASLLAVGGAAWVINEIYRAKLLKLLQARGKEPLFAFYLTTTQFRMMLRAAEGRRGALVVLYAWIRGRFSNLDWPDDLPWVAASLQEWLARFPNDPPLKEAARTGPVDAFAAWLWAARPISQK